MAVFAVVCLLNALLAWSASNADVSTNHRLLDLQVRQAASTLGAALPGLETPLTAAFDVAMVTHDPNEFKTIMASDVGPAAQFVSASLWQIAPGPPKPLIVVGAPPDLTVVRATALFSGVRPGGPLMVTRFLSGTSPRLGYAEIPAGGGSSEAVYAESPLPPHKKAVVPKSSAFSDLDFSLYLGHAADRSSLIETTGPPSWLPRQSQRAFRRYRVDLGRLVGCISGWWSLGLAALGGRYLRPGAGGHCGDDG